MMRTGNLYLYYGEGRGKTTLAIGQGMRALGEELSVVMVQFLDYNHNKEYIPLQKLEPQFRAFRFEKQRESIDEADKSELGNEIKLAYNFGKKIIETAECDMLILDGICDAVDLGFLSDEDVAELLKKRGKSMDIIVTGSHKHEKIAYCADYVYSINVEKRREDI